MTASLQTLDVRGPSARRLGAFLGALGLLGAGFALAVGARTTTTVSDGSVRTMTLFGGEVIMATALCLFTAFAGRRLWRGQPHGWLLAFFAVGAQVVWVDVNGLQFALLWPLKVSLSAAWDAASDWNLLLGYQFGIAYHFGFSSGLPTQSIGINLPPALLLLYLLQFPLAESDGARSPTPAGAIAGDGRA